MGLAFLSLFVFEDKEFSYNMVPIARVLALLFAFEGATSYTTNRLYVQSANRLSRQNSIQTRAFLHRAPSQLNLLSQKKELSDPQTTFSSKNDVTTSALSAPPQDDEDMFKAAIQKTLIWVAAAVAFGTGLGVFVDPTTAEEFFAGYLLEQSLSVDNLLVFLLLFEYFRIPTAYQNRILNWGIIGAIFMRAIMIGAGAVALQQFHAVLLGFAAILIYSSAKVLVGGNEDEEEDFSQNAIVKFSNNIIQSTNKFDGDRFFTVVDGVKLATPMLLCMVAVEFSDVVFAVDSIPAVFGVTEVSSIHTLRGIRYTPNLFASNFSMPNRFTFFLLLHRIPWSFSRPICLQSWDSEAYTQFYLKQHRN